MARTGAGVTALDTGVWLVTDPAATEELLTAAGAGTARAGLRTSVTDWGADGLAHWMAARHAMRPALAASRVAPLGSAMVEATAAVIDTWPARGTVDGMCEAVRMVAAVNVAFVLGRPYGAVSSLIDHELDVAQLTGVPGPLAVRRRRRLLDAQRATCAAIRDAVRAGPAEPGSLRAAVAGAGLDERRTVLALRNMLLSGHRVPAAALAWVLHELASNPAVQADLRHDARAGDPAASPVVRSVIRETLRLHPPVWRFDRELAEPAGRFPAGAILRFSNYANQRDPGSFQDAGEFRPQRWQEEPHPSPGSYFPFGLGPRFCPGSQLALTELAAAVTTVVTAYRLTLDSPPHPSPGPLHAPDGLWLRVESLSTP